MDDAEIQRLFQPLFAGLPGEDSFPKKRPLLAHYTSVAVLEAILRNNEVWFSNPMFMNDGAYPDFSDTVCRYTS